MNVLLLVQIFETPDDTGSDRHFYFAKQLVAAGNRVKVITANVDYKNSEKRFKDKTGVYEQNIDGVDIKYVPVYTKFRGSFLKRVVFFMSYFASSLREVVRERRVDIIYAVSTPLTVGLLGMIARIIKRKPMIFEVTDVWPDAAVHAGVIKNLFLISIISVVEKLCYYSSTKIICLTKGIQSTIQKKGVSAEKTVLIPNGVDFEFFRCIDSAKRTSLRESWSVKDKFVAMYLGAHGAYNSLWTIVEAAAILSENDKIHFIFVGEGDEKSKLLTFVEEKRLKNVTFIGTVPRVKSVEILSMADLFLLPNRRGEFFHGNLPNKLFDFLASSRPVIVAGHGESANLVSEASAGFVVDAENSQAFANEICKCSELPIGVSDLMGKNGRSHTMKYYNRASHASILVDLISKLHHIRTDR